MNEENTVDNSESKSSENILKVSPCSRYQRLDKPLENLIGIGSAYLGMDVEEGIEVSWAEVSLKISNQDLSKVKLHFDCIIRFNHPSLLKCHTYWIEELPDGVCTLYVICELINSTLVHFIKRTKNNKKTIPFKTQARLCRQILMALINLNSFSPPFYLSNLLCKTVFMTHEGYIKVSTIVPNTSIAVLLTESSNVECLNANEEESDSLSHSIFNFGHIVYSLATLDLFCGDLNDLLKNTCSLTCLTPEHKDLLGMCIKGTNVSISQLLLSKMLQEFPSLKLLSCATIIKLNLDISSYNVDAFSNDRVFAEFVEASKNFTYSDVPSLDLSKFIDEIRKGLYPITNLTSEQPKKSNETSSITTPSPHSLINDGSMDSPSSPFYSKSDNEECTSSIDDSSQLIAIQCHLEHTPAVSDASQTQASKDILKLDLLFGVPMGRHIETSINFESDNSTLLSEDLLAQKVVSHRYQSILIEAIDKALKGEWYSSILSTKS